MHVEFSKISKKLLIQSLVSLLSSKSQTVCFHQWFSIYTSRNEVWGPTGFCPGTLSPVMTITGSFHTRKKFIVSVMNKVSGMNVSYPLSVQHICCIIHQDVDIIKKIFDD